MQFHFFPVIRAASEQYGDAILSRYPMEVVRVGELPRTRGAIEPRGALWVEIEAEGLCWQVLNTHLGLGRSERRAQARALGEWTCAALQRPPVVFCGDLNSRSGSLVHALLGEGMGEVQLAARGFQQQTFATWLPWVCLDYIYVSPDVKVLSAEVVTTPLTRIASDHFPLTAELRAMAPAGAMQLPAIGG
jgi:endonuclease/exonuclease/phosphatase family metal-dependent hydrolase